MNLKHLLMPLLATSVLVAACGGSTDKTDAPTTSRATLTVATDASYPPIEFMGADGKTIQGMDADLAKALGAKLDMDVRIQHAPFDSILPGLSTKKFDVGMSGFTDTKEREETFDFVTYFTAGTSFLVNGAGGPAINTLDDLCGHSVALSKGTTQVDDATAQSKKCAAAGKPAVRIMTFPDQPGANLAVISGRAEVGMADSPGAAYQAKLSGGKLKVVGQPYGTAPYGIALPKGSPLVQPMQNAMKALIADGTYGRILAKYGIESGAIAQPLVNQAAH